ncbi:hypothetical protein SAY87_032284 [Trapa incisa]|uniref:Uncharacterized protein n=1 Tax=Trapa incisa TaxID=236973 RepID=A0AAN7G9E0_9MYRT|nr:hypothetical protein SAY87_032266 [Trapa incisa]KAK4740605.1 hypothetical protein SAY87_032284 [Trapa incisa]
MVDVPRDVLAIVFQCSLAHTAPGLRYEESKVQRGTRVPGGSGQSPARIVGNEFAGASGVLKATSADPWSASFMVETRTLFVFHKSKNFTSDYEIRMPPTVPVNHYSNPEGQHNRTGIL